MDIYLQETEKYIQNGLQAFDQYFVPKKNIIVETFKFGNIHQQIDNFATDLEQESISVNN